MSLKLSHKALILVATPLVFELAFVGVLAYMLSQAEAEATREASARQKAHVITQLTHDVYSAGDSINGLNLSRKSKNQKRFRSALDKSDGDLNELKALCRSSPEQLKNALAVERTWKELLQLVETASALDAEAEEGPTDFVAVLKMRKRLAKLTTQLANQIMTLDIVERRIIEESPKKQAEFRKNVENILLATVAFNVLLAFGLALYFNLGTTERLKILMDNTKRLASSNPLHPALKGTDEMASLDSVFREMADALATARRKEKAILENTLDVICTIDSAGRFSAVNAACRETWGYEPEELIGKPLIDFVEPDDVEQTMNMAKQVRYDKVLAPVENRIKCKDQTIVDTLWSMRWSEPEQSLFCVAHDITERKRLERAKQEFVAMVSHDLRTPLTTIQGVLALLQNDKYAQLSEMAEDDVKAAENSAVRLISMINDLLDIEKMQSGKIELDLRDIEVSFIFERALEAVDGFADQQGVEIFCTASNTIINADSDRLVQVIINLLSNAVKFSPKGSTVDLQAIGEDEAVKIEVVDRGRGIPETALKSVFERFRQVEKGDSKIQHGSGLGLSICKAIVEQHGGTIGVDSEEGKGSTFWFRIPLSEKAINRTPILEGREVKSE